MNDVRDDDGIESEEDRRLTALLAATHAPANPAVWMRVRAELSPAARPATAGALDRILAWFTRPAALAAASAALVVALGASWSLLGTIAAPDENLVVGGTTTFIETLLDDTAAAAADTAGESEVPEAPTDSGGRS